MKGEETWLSLAQIRLVFTTKPRWCIPQCIFFKPHFGMEGFDGRFLRAVSPNIQTVVVVLTCHLVWMSITAYHIDDMSVPTYNIFSNLILTGAIYWQNCISNTSIWVTRDFQFSTSSCFPLLIDSNVNSNLHASLLICHYLIVHAATLNILRM